MELLAQRLKILKSDFDDLREKVKRTEDADERHVLLRQLGEIITEIDALIRESQKRLEVIIDRLRLRSS